MFYILYSKYCLSVEDSWYGAFWPVFNILYWSKGWEFMLWSFLASFQHFVLVKRLRIHGMELIGQFSTFCIGQKAENSWYGAYWPIFNILYWSKGWEFMVSRLLANFQHSVLVKRLRNHGKELTGQCSTFYIGQKVEESW